MAKAEFNDPVEIIRGKLNKRQKDIYRIASNPSARRGELSSCKDLKRSIASTIPVTTISLR